MALFGFGGKSSKGKKGKATVPIPGKQFYCRVCNDDVNPRASWHRLVPMVTCPCCGMAFDNIVALYDKLAPACPHCKEPLEHPGIDYSLCERCGSKYELVEGGKPGLLPNKQQREALDKQGRTWSYDE